MHKELRALDNSSCPRSMPMSSSMWKPPCRDLQDPSWKQKVLLLPTWLLRTEHLTSTGRAGICVHGNQLQLGTALLLCTGYFHFSFTVSPSSLPSCQLKHPPWTRTALAAGSILGLSQAPAQRFRE